MNVDAAFLRVLLLAVAVAVDATAVASTAAFAYRDFKYTDVLRLSLTFGAFQGGMAFLGWMGGVALENRIAAWDHWVAFIVLGALGVLMIRGSLVATDVRAPQRLTTPVLLSLAVATSIDALAVGVTLGVLNTSAVISCGLIALVTFVLSLLGGWFGRRLGDRFGKRLEIIGGVLLILIGAHIVFSHLR